MISLKTIFLSIALCITGGLFSQDDIIIIDKGALKASRKKDPIIVNCDEIYKFSPLQMIKGEINFGYERKLAPKTSLEIEIGPTISEIGNLNYHVYYDPYYNSAVRESNIGFFASTGFRYYPMDNNFAPNRFYVSPVLKYRMFNYNVKDAGGVLDTQVGQENELNFLFNFGYQMWLSKTFSLDFFTGMGIGLNSGRDYSVHSEWDYYTNTYQYSWEKSTYSGAKYVFTMGVKVGIGRNKSVD